MGLFASRMAPGSESAGTRAPAARTFRRRIKIGFACVVALAATITVVSLFALRWVVVAKDEVISEYRQDLVVTRELELAAEQNASSSRAFLLTGDSRYLAQAQAAEERFQARAESLKATTPLAEESRLLKDVVNSAAAHHASMDQAVLAERSHGDPRRAAEVFEEEVRPRRKALRDALAGLVHEKERLLQDVVRKSRVGADDAMLFVAMFGIGAAVLAGIPFYLSTRMLARLAEAEAEIRDLNEHLEEKVRERTREIEGFAYAVAHDLRAPLRAMAGFSSILLEDHAPQLDSSGKDALRRIRSSAHWMDDLIHGLLGLARLSYQPYTLVPVDLLQIVRDVLSAKEREILAVGARVEADIPPIQVLANPSLLALSLGHLVDNALKFVTPGVAPCLLVRGELRNNDVRLSVSDNGIGIPPEHHHRVFGVFERLHPAQMFPGVGIGLAIVRRAAQRMEGVVGVHSNPGNGATFWMDLRRVPASAEHGPFVSSRVSGLPGPVTGVPSAHLATEGGRPEPPA